MQYIFGCGNYSVLSRRKVIYFVVLDLWLLDLEFRCCCNISRITAERRQRTSYFFLCFCYLGASAARNHAEMVPLPCTGEDFCTCTSASAQIETRQLLNYDLSIFFFPRAVWLEPMTWPSTNVISFVPRGRTNMCEGRVLRFPDAADVDWWWWTDDLLTTR